MLNLIKKNLLLIIKRFLWLLLLQFFLHTLITFWFGLEWKIWTVVWMRKELLIVFLSIFLLWYLSKKISKEKFLEMWKVFPLKKFLFVFVSTLLIILVISFFNSSVSNFVISVRYSMFWFFLFLLFFVISFLFFQDKKSNLVYWYTKIIKWVLVWSLAWWGIIRLIPNWMRFFGYNQRAFEWKVWERPPAVYYTQYKEWFVRNQFVFERPISLWFYLVVFWPLFFVLLLYKKWPKAWATWWSLYAIILLSTFSRAARWVWLFQTVLLFFLFYWRNQKKIFYRFLIPIVIWLAIVTYYWKDQIINRQYSNTWHIKEVLIALEKVKESPILWKWAASAGPASHHLWKWKEYNPENQYLQIWIEYGLVAFVGWMFLYIYLHLIWYWAWKDSKKEKETKDLRNMSILVTAFSIWLLGLSIEWMVLHSFVDRMIVYPFVTVFAIYYAIYYKEKKHLSF